MIKKIICVFCALSLLVSLAACGNTENSSESSKSGVDSDDTVASNVTSETDNDRTLWETKMVALTFDDGPCEYTDALLDVLKERGVKATFFMIGQNAEKYPEKVKRVIDEGHDVGCHTYTHSDWRQASHETVKAEMDKFVEQIHKAVPDYTVKWLRGPGGGYNDYVIEECVNRNWCIFTWTNSLDETLTSADEIAATAYNEAWGVRNGEVILIHVKNQLMVDATACLIDRLVSEGYTLVTLTELMQRRNGGIAGKVYTNPIY